MTGPQMLIAEDDAELAQALSRRCASLGIHAVTAGDGLRAVTLAHELHPELICLDVNMPAGNGMAVCELLMSDPTFRETDFIVLTGDSNTEIVQRCHRYGAYFIPKCDEVWSRVEPLLRELLKEFVTAPDPPQDKDQASATLDTSTPEL